MNIHVSSCVYFLHVGDHLALLRFYVLIANLAVIIIMSYNKFFHAVQYTRTTPIVKTHYVIKHVLHATKQQDFCGKLMHVAILYSGIMTIIILL